MASFFDQLRPASFRGIPFLTPDDDSGISRRIARHEFPGRDEPYHEDLGLGVQEFTVEAIIQGTDFVNLAESFEQALIQKGPATLIHPHYGELEVVVTRVRRFHSTSGIGEIRFSVSMEKYGKPLYPSAARDTAAALDQAAAGAYSAAQSDFLENFTVAPGLDFLVGDALGRAMDYTRELRSALTKAGVFRQAGSFQDSWDVLDGGFAGEVVGLFEDLAAVVKPRNLRMIGPAPASAASGRDAVSIVTALTRSAGTSLTGDLVSASKTAAQATRVTNAKSLEHLFQMGSMASAVQASRYAAYESREEAVAVRQAIADRLEDLRDSLGASGWDDSWRAAGQMLAAVSRDINERIGRLPKTVRIKPAGVGSSLALSNRLYGDDPAVIFARGGDLAQRNAIRHPGFVPVQELEVLIDA